MPASIKRHLKEDDSVLIEPDSAGNLRLVERPGATLREYVGHQINSPTKYRRRQESNGMTTTRKILPDIRFSHP